MTDLTKNALLPSILMWYNSLGLLDLKITTAQVVKMSVIVNNSPILNYARPDNQMYYKPYPSLETQEMLFADWPQ